MLQHLPPNLGPEDPFNPLGPPMRVPCALDPSGIATELEYADGFLYQTELTPGAPIGLPDLRQINQVYRMISVFQDDEDDYIMYILYWVERTEQHGPPKRVLGPADPLNPTGPEEEFHYPIDVGRRTTRQEYEDGILYQTEIDKGTRITASERKLVEHEEVFIIGCRNDDQAGVMYITYWAPRP